MFVLKAFAKIQISALLYMTIFKQAGWPKKHKDRKRFLVLMCIYM